MNQHMMVKGLKTRSGHDGLVKHSRDRSATIHHSQSAQTNKTSKITRSQGFISNDYGIIQHQAKLYQRANELTQTESRRLKRNR